MASEFDQVADQIALPNSFLTGEKKRKPLQNSTFLITINSNVSAHTRDTETFARVGKKLIFTGMKLEQNFRSGALLKAFGSSYDYRVGYKPPNVTRFDYGLERGDKLGHAHLHIVVSFDGPTHIQQDQFREYIRGILAPEVTNPHINIRWVKDGVQAANTYIHKFV